MRKYKQSKALFAIKPNKCEFPNLPINQFNTSNNYFPKKIILTNRQNNQKKNNNSALRIDTNQTQFLNGSPVIQRKRAISQLRNRYQKDDGRQFSDQKFLQNNKFVKKIKRRTNLKQNLSGRISQILSLITKNNQNIKNHPAKQLKSLHSQILMSQTKQQLSKQIQKNFQLSSYLKQKYSDSNMISKTKYIASNNKLQNTQFRNLEKKGKNNKSSRLYRQQLNLSIKTNHLSHQFTIQRNINQDKNDKNNLDKIDKINPWQDITSPKQKYSIVQYTHKIQTKNQI